jgi:hypothetical protein
MTEILYRSPDGRHLIYRRADGSIVLRTTEISTLRGKRVESSTAEILKSVKEARSKIALLSDAKAGFAVPARPPASR